jgi:hypothetical protein
MPHPSVALAIRECYRRAAQAKRLAANSIDPEEKRDLLAVKQKWLALARSQELEEVSEHDVKKALGWLKR